MTERERITGKLSHADCDCPCHFERSWTDNCRCGYDGRDEPRPRTGYFGTMSSQVQFYLPPDGKHKIATVWVEAGKLMIQMDADNVFDVIFVDGYACRPRNIDAVGSRDVG